MIQQPIPYLLNQYVTFSDTLAVDDVTEVLAVTKPDSSVVNYAHNQLARTANADGTVTYSIAVKLDQRGQWLGVFTAITTDANSAYVQAYVAL